MWTIELNIAGHQFTNRAPRRRSLRAIRFTRPASRRGLRSRPNSGA